MTQDQEATQEIDDVSIDGGSSGSLDSASMASVYWLYFIGNILILGLVFWLFSISAVAVVATAILLSLFRIAITSEYKETFNNE